MFYFDSWGKIFYMITEYIKLTKLRLNLLKYFYKISL